jgi:hypothetical protein
MFLAVIKDGNKYGSKNKEKKIIKKNEIKRKKSIYAEKEKV